MEEAVPLPNELTGVHFFSLGGAINRVGVSETAYPHRDAIHLLEIPAQWESTKQMTR